MDHQTQEHLVPVAALTLDPVTWENLAPMVKQTKQEERLNLLEEKALVMPLPRNQAVMAVAMNHRREKMLDKPPTKKSVVMAVHMKPMLEETPQMQLFMKLVVKRALKALDKNNQHMDMKHNPVLVQSNRQKLHQENPPV